MALVFIAVSGGQLRTWAETGTLDGHHPGYAVTPAMVDAFGVTDPEDAEYAALCIASIAGLLGHGQRIVAVAEAPVQPTQDEFGEVGIADLPYRAVTSLFAEDAATSQAAEAAAAVRGSSLADAWEAAEVQALLSDTDLLWYGPAEWAMLVG